jgi:hypothetical protein
MMCEFQSDIPNGNTLVGHGAGYLALQQRGLMDLYS